MSESDSQVRVKPLFLITPGAIKTRDILRVEEQCGVVIVECKNPDAVRLLEPPLDAGMDAQARAALSLARYLVNHDGTAHTTFSKADLVQFFTKTLMYAPSPPTVKKVQK